jgi:hypothetical protein
MSIDPLAAWAAELHRQLEKIWYTPKGVAYSDAEAQAVIDVLGPTDDAVPNWGPLERATDWHKHHGGA